MTTLDEMLATLSQKRQKKIQNRVNKLKAEERTMRELRKARRMIRVKLPNQISKQK